MKYKMKLAKRHPHNAMNFGGHVITNVENVFELSKDEVKMLDMSEPKHWFSVEKFEEKKVSKKVTKKDKK